MSTSFLELCWHPLQHVLEKKGLLFPQAIHHPFSLTLERRGDAVAGWLLVSGILVLWLTPLLFLLPPHSHPLP